MENVMQPPIEADQPWLWLPVGIGCSYGVRRTQLPNGPLSDAELDCVLRRSAVLLWHAPCGQA
jgi:hypothetical protein